MAFNKTGDSQILLVQEKISDAKVECVEAAKSEEETFVKENS